MRLSPLALLGVACASLLVGCDLVTNNSDKVSITGTVTCSDGKTVSAGNVGIYQGRPSSCLLPCEPSNAPVLAEQRLGSDGRFALSLSLNDGSHAEDLWILAGADGNLCGAGFNVVSKPLGPVEGGSDVHGLALVIRPFVT